MLLKHYSVTCIVIVTDFAFMFIFTYMYAFRASKKIYALFSALYVTFVLWLYLPVPFGFGRNILNLVRLEFLWIPMILYGLAGLFALTQCISRRITKRILLALRRA